jgi:hypothetical protein
MVHTIVLKYHCQASAVAVEITQGGKALNTELTTWVLTPFASTDQTGGIAPNLPGRRSRDDV